MLNLLFLLYLLLNEISVIFSDLMLPNEMSGYTENISTLIFVILILFLSYKSVKVYRMVFYKDVHHNKNSLYHNTTENDS